MSTGFRVPPPPFVSGKATVSAHAASGNVAVADFGKNHTNTGAGATIVLTLPAAATAGGLSLRVQVTAAFAVRLTPAAGESVYLGGDGVASKYLELAGVIGNYIEIYCDAVSYEAIAYSGVATKEA